MIIDPNLPLSGFNIQRELKHGPYAGQGEIPAEPIEGLIINPASPTKQFTALGQEDAYGLFGYAFDGN